MTLSATARAIPSRAGTVAEPMCGSRTQRGASSSASGYVGLALVDVQAGGAERPALERRRDGLGVDEWAPRRC